MAATCFQRLKLMNWSCQCLPKIDGAMAAWSRVEERLPLDDDVKENETGLMEEGDRAKETFFFFVFCFLLKAWKWFKHCRYPFVPTLPERKKKSDACSIEKKRDKVFRITNKQTNKQTKKNTLCDPYNKDRFINE